MDESANATVPRFYSDGEPHMSPARMLEHFCHTRNITIDQLGIRPVAILTFFVELAQMLADRCGAQRSPFGLPAADRQLFVADEFCILRVPIGAPAAVTAAEELIAGGAREFVVVGAAGSLQPDLPIGASVLPAAAIREEGTSHHYLPPEVPATATPRTLDALRRAWKGDAPPREGLHWTTDAPYREHREKIATYREAGVLSVDMEISALYALARHRRVGCASIVAISDELYEPWRIGFGSQEFLDTVVRCGLAALDAARTLAKPTAEAAP